MKNIIESMPDLPIPSCPDTEEFKPKPCEDCGVIVEPYFIRFPSSRNRGEMIANGHWIAPPRYCKGCQEKHEAKRMHEERIEEILNSCNFKKRQQDMTLGNFKPYHVEHKKTLAALLSYTPESGKNVLLHGGVGRGKTHLIVGLVKKLILEEKVSQVRFVTGVSLLRSVRYGFLPAANCSSDSMIDAYGEFPLLIIDDLGLEKPSEWAIETLYTIIDERYSGFRPTFITSNMNPKQLAARLDDRLMSRLLHDALVLKIEGKDYRLG